MVPPGKQTFQALRFLFGHGGRPGRNGGGKGKNDHGLGQNNMPTGFVSVFTPMKQAVPDGRQDTEVISLCRWGRGLLNCHVLVRHHPLAAAIFAVWGRFSKGDWVPCALLSYQKCQGILGKFKSETWFMQGIDSLIVWQVGIILKMIIEKIRPEKHHRKRSDGSYNLMASLLYFSQSKTSGSLFFLYWLGLSFLLVWDTCWNSDDSVGINFFTLLLEHLCH